MLWDILILAASLGLILLFCSWFVNAVEALGHALKLHQGIVGSILAAVGTALPETIIPIIAIVFTRGHQAVDVGIGAIAGAPFMLGTLAFFVSGAAVLVFSWLKKRRLQMHADVVLLRKDLTFFLAVYGVAVSTTFLPNHALRSIIALALLLAYAWYLKLTVEHAGEHIVNAEPLYLARWLKWPQRLPGIYLQLAISLAGIIWAAQLFIEAVIKTSTAFGLEPLLLSIIITPIATELPEKFNSVIWIGKNKDTLALGNITGAMVFQSCFPVVFGIWFTPWHLTGLTLLSAVLALASAGLTVLWLTWRKNLNPWVLLAGGFFYGLFILKALRVY